MAECRSYVIVGNGIAGVTAAETLRQEQPTAEITIIARTPAPACYRPALKDYLVGRASEETLFARRPGYYADKGLRFVLDSVVDINTARHQLLLRGGQSIGYDRLLLATGTRPRRLTCPGSELTGVLTLRSMGDYQNAQRFLKSARRVVVCGAGPLALETVDALRQGGMQVTHLLRRRRILAGMLDRTASELVLHQEQEAGVDVRFEEEIVEIAGKQGQVVGVITNKGARIPCDLLVMAIGADPVIDVIKAAGIACERGVMVDQGMRSSIADVYAAGDVAETPDPLVGHARLIGHWYPAMQQGRAAAYSMLGMLDALRLLHAATFSNAYLRPITTFTLFGFDIAAIGITHQSAPVYEEVTADTHTHIYSKALLKNGVPVGMLSFDGSRDNLAFKRAIDHAVNLAPVIGHLFSQDFKFTTWLDTKKVPAPVLAVRKTNAPTPTTPIRATRNQFAPAAPLLDLDDDDSDDEENGNSMEVRLRANGDPYTLPAISVPRPNRVEKGEEASRRASAQISNIGSISAAFLAPVIPARTAQMLVDREALDRAPTIALSREDPNVAVAPQETHTPLTQAGTVTIGREASSSLVINHQSISRHHAEIACVNGVYLLRDLGSRNGTFVNEKRLAPGREYALKPRDHIRIGNLMTYQFQVRVPVATRS